MAKPLGTYLPEVFQWGSSSFPRNVRDVQIATNAATYERSVSWKNSTGERFHMDLGPYSAMLDPTDLDPLLVAMRLSG